MQIADQRYAADHRSPYACAPESLMDLVLRRSLIAIAAVVLIVLAWEPAKQIAFRDEAATPVNGTRVATLLVEPFADLRPPPLEEPSPADFGRRSWANWRGSGN